MRCSQGGKHVFVSWHPLPFDPHTSIVGLPLTHACTAPATDRSTNNQLATSHLEGNAVFNIQALREKPCACYGPACAATAMICGIEWRVSFQLLPDLGEGDAAASSDAVRRLEVESLGRPRIPKRYRDTRIALRFGDRFVRRRGVCRFDSTAGRQKAHRDSSSSKQGRHVHRRRVLVDYVHGLL